ncbi:MAG: hypothetical protein H6713_23580 [Myxococcales bacterium]|nr:hypothetical protein [Myxococcales bacterium]
MNPARWIELERYPLLNLQDPAGQALVAGLRAQLRAQGACVIEGLLRPEALARAVSEVESLEDQAFHQTVVGNAYLRDPAPDLPPEHAERIMDTTALGVLARDQLPAGTVLADLYAWDPLLRFVEAIVDRGALYRYGCPLGALNVAVMGAGDSLRWHFDQSDFVVSIPLRHAARGGVFEWVRDVRRPDDERYADVAAVLRGESRDVRALPMPPGSLVLFEGRYTLHRVTRIDGPVTRLVALLAYSDVPGRGGSDYLKRMRYGRIA